MNHNDKGSSVSAKESEQGEETGNEQLARELAERLQVLYGYQVGLNDLVPALLDVLEGWTVGGQGQAEAEKPETDSANAATPPAHIEAEVLRQATPRPWRVRHIYSTLDEMQIVGAENPNGIPLFQTVAEVWIKNGIAKAEARANAKLIVAAVNALSAPPVTDERPPSVREPDFWLCSGRIFEMTVKWRDQGRTWSHRKVHQIIRETILSPRTDSGSRKEESAGAGTRVATGPKDPEETGDTFIAIAKELDAAGVAIANERGLYTLLERVRHLITSKNYFYRELDESRETVNKVWKALGINTYAEAGGKAIWEIVASRVSPVSKDGKAATESVSPLKAEYASDLGMVIAEKVVNRIFTKFGICVDDEPEWKKWVAQIANEVINSSLPTRPEKDEGHLPLLAQTLGDVFSNSLKGRKRNWQGSLDVSWNEREAWNRVAEHVEKLVNSSLPKQMTAEKTLSHLLMKLGNMHVYRHHGGPDGPELFHTDNCWVCELLKGLPSLPVAEPNQDLEDK